MWARAFLDAGAADPALWAASDRSPTAFLEKAIEGWLGAVRDADLVSFSVGLVTNGEWELVDGPGNPGVAWVWAGPQAYTDLVVGPALREMETAHAALPVSWYRALTHGLAGFFRVWDYEDARESLDWLDDEYEMQDEESAFELDKAIPACFSRRRLARPRMKALIPRLPRMSAELVRTACEAEDLRTASRWRWPSWPHELDYNFDEGPTPAAVISIEENDDIKGLFDRFSHEIGATGNAAPNLLLRLDAKKPATIRKARQVLGAFGQATTLLSRTAILLNEARGIPRPNRPLMEVLGGYEPDDDWVLADEDLEPVGDAA